MVGLFSVRNSTNSITGVRLPISHSCFSRIAMAARKGPVPEVVGTLDSFPRRRALLSDYRKTNRQTCIVCSVDTNTWNVIELYIIVYFKVGAGMVKNKATIRRYRGCAVPRYIEVFVRLSRCNSFELA